VAPTFVAPVQTWPVAAASPSGLAIVHDTLYMATSNGGDKDSIPNNSANVLLHVALGDRDRPGG
jgi:hypothetical protein